MPAPEYPDKTAIARELCIAESTVDDFVRRGILPPPFRLSTGCVRWSWKEVEAAIATRRPAAETHASDPYMAGAENVTTIKGRKRGAA